MTDNTQDLSEFGYTELEEAGKLLTAYCKDSPDFLGESIAVEYNPNSGCVFLVDSDYNVGMMNGNDLEKWLSCPECGEEGFVDDLINVENDCCIKYLAE